MVGLDKRCETVEISFPYRNLHYSREGSVYDSFAPMRWMHLSKNDRQEYELDYIKPDGRGVIRKSPCWSKYLEQWQSTEKKGKFDPEAWYQ